MGGAIATPPQMPNIRSPEAAQWRRLYKLARWQHLRRWVLNEQPLCQRCQAQGQITAATDVHHNPPHEGDINRFWHGPFEALCKPCHDGPVGKAERTGRDYDTELGPDGWPLDPRHPANRTTPHWHPSPAPDAPHPSWLRPSTLPVHLVCGPPASGKTSYVNDHADLVDLILDLDAIRDRIAGRRITGQAERRAYLTVALTERNRMLASLAQPTRYRHAWLIVGEPSPDAPTTWARPCCASTPPTGTCSLRRPWISSATVTAGCPRFTRCHRSTSG